MTRTDMAERTANHHQGGHEYHDHHNAHNEAGHSKFEMDWGKPVNMPVENSSEWSKPHGYRGSYDSYENNKNNDLPPWKQNNDHLPPWKQYHQHHYGYSPNHDEVEYYDPTNIDGSPFDPMLDPSYVNGPPSMPPPPPPPKESAKPTVSVSTASTAASSASTSPTDQDPAGLQDLKASLGLHLNNHGEQPRKFNAPPNLPAILPTLDWGAPPALTPQDSPLAAAPQSPPSYSGSTLPWKNDDSSGSITPILNRSGTHTPPGLGGSNQTPHQPPPGGYFAGLSTSMPPMLRPSTGALPPGLPFGNLDHTGLWTPGLSQSQGAYGTPSNRTSQMNKAAVCKEVVPIEERYVGLIFGKNAVTLRGLKEESGASIFIDKDTPPGEPKNVIIRGSRVSVDEAVKRVHALIEGKKNSGRKAAEERRHCGKLKDCLIMLFERLNVDELTADEIVHDDIVGASWEAAGRPSLMKLCLGDPFEVLPEEDGKFSVKFNAGLFYRDKTEEFIQERQSLLESKRSVSPEPLESPVGHSVGQMFCVEEDVVLEDSPKAGDKEARREGIISRTLEHAATFSTRTGSSTPQSSREHNVEHNAPDPIGKAVVLADFGGCGGDTSTQLRASAGEVVDVMYVGDGSGWTYCRKNGVEGWMPHAFLNTLQH